VLFTTYAYAILFSVAFAGTWALALVEYLAADPTHGPFVWRRWPALAARSGLLRVGFLLVLSYYFYASWNWRYLPLIFCSSTVDYLLARAIARAPRPQIKRAMLVATVLLNLGFLGCFKYWNFVLDSAWTVRSLFARDSPPTWSSTLRLALPPVGISFFTFESMSYVIDVYRGELAPCGSYLRYLLFVSFFPHLVAGPIVRPRDLLPQLERRPVLTREASGEALFAIAVGLVKKLAISDQLSRNLVDRVFEQPANYSALEVLFGVYGYAVQLFFDFSGYTDIATGSALLLGIRFAKNFDAPYLATNIADFWRRWHISLSTWLRDYLYIPLGGSRGSAWTTYRNLMLTMVLGGLWHGPSWTFVFWGFLHGSALAATRAWQRTVGGPARTSGLIANIAGIVLTFHFVCFAWIFFRATSFSHAALILKELATGTTFHPNLPPLVVVVLLVGLLTQFAPQCFALRCRQAFIALSSPAQAAVLFAVAIVLHETASTAAVPFVYFQF
jgi:D-alanyl-lipoteichoic acid acyltransferase DltB (MBOAT superfamily)